MGQYFFAEHYEGYCSKCGYTCRCSKCDKDYHRMAFVDRPKSEIVKDLRLLEYGSVDYALQEDWFKEMCRMFVGESILSMFVWFYNHRTGGEGPYPLTDKARQFLKIYNERQGTSYPLV